MLYGQRDTISEVRITRIYTLSEDYSEIVPLELDTLLNGFIDYRAGEKITPFYADQGNYGQPALEIDFFSRNREYDHFLYSNLKPYMHHTGNKRFIDTQVPFTDLRFFFGGPRALAEQSLKVRHSQNVNRNLNLGLNLEVLNSLGQYSYQTADSRAFTLHTSYLGKRYRAFAAWSLNNITRMENGGIIYEGSEETGVNDPSFLANYDTRDVPVNLGRLNSAENSLKNRNLLVVQRYRVGRVETIDNPEAPGDRRESRVEGTFSHILSLDYTGRSYSDKLPLGGFYDTAYISNDTNRLPTADSLYFRVLKNTLRFDFSTRESARFRLGIGVGVRNEINLYKQVIPTYDTLYADTARWNNSSNAIVGRLYNRIGDKFGWEASGEIWMTGYRSGDFYFDGSLQKIFGEGKRELRIKGNGSLSSTRPVWWQNNWGSNHFAWNNDFGNEVRAEAGGELLMQGIKLRISADYALVTNHIYFGREALPTQYEGAISILAARLEKDIRFWKINFNNKLLLQTVSHGDIIPLPLLTVKSALYFDHEFNFRSTGGKLQVQMGVQALYHSSYYACSYMPSTSVYYTQNIMETGNYPFIDGFMAIKLKRTRIFVAFDHLNQGLNGYNYFMVPGYPMPVRTFKYGVSWTFYN